MKLDQERLQRLYPAMDAAFAQRMEQMIRHLLLMEYLQE